MNSKQIQARIKRDTLVEAAAVGLRRAPVTGQTYTVGGDVYQRTAADFQETPQPEYGPGSFYMVVYNSQGKPEEIYESVVKSQEIKFIGLNVWIATSGRKVVWENRSLPFQLKIQPFKLVGLFALTFVTSKLFNKFFRK